MMIKFRRFILTYVGVPWSSWSTPILKVVEHGAIKGRWSPAGAQFWGHITCWIWTGIGATETSSILVPAVGWDTKRAAISRCFSGSSCWDGGAGSKGEPWGYWWMRRSRVVSNALSSRLSPNGVAGDWAALLGWTTPLEVRQAGDHGSDPCGGYVHRRSSSCGVHKTAGPFICWWAMVGCHC